MFKEKLYSGTLATYTGTTNIKRYPSSSTLSVNIYKTDLLNECIVDFLVNECGMSQDDVVYYPIENGTDDRKGNLYIFGMPTQHVIIGANNLYKIYNSEADFTAYTSSSATTSYTIFNNGTYYFKLCMIGNPNSGFIFFISNNNLDYPVQASSSFGYIPRCYYKIKDLTSEDYHAVTAPLISNSATVYLYENSENKAITLLSPYGAVTTAQMQWKPNKYPKIPKLLGVPFYELVNGYELVSYTALGLANNTYSSPSTPHFYKIGNDNYCMISTHHGLLIEL